jgi:hypothetical protein
VALVAHLIVDAPLVHLRLEETSRHPLSDMAQLDVNGWRLSRGPQPRPRPHAFGDRHGAREVGLD